MRKRIQNFVLDLFFITLIIGISFYTILSIPSLEAFFPNNLFGTNRLILIENVKNLKIIYIDRNKKKIELDYNIRKKDNKELIKGDSINFFDYFEGPNGLLSIDILKANSKSLEKEFSEKLDENFYVGYLDKSINNLYVFAHNGALWINGWTVFYKMKKGENVSFYNSLINEKVKYKVTDKIVLKKKDFIKSFTTGTKIFSARDSIFLITCYPNYSSTSRLILRLKKNK